MFTMLSYSAVPLSTVSQAMPSLAGLRQTILNYLSDLSMNLCNK